MNVPTKHKQNPEKAAVLKILKGTHKGKQFRLIGSRILIGSHSDCDIVFKNNKTISPQHAMVSFESNAYFIKSLDSKNPVIIENKKVDLHNLQNGHEMHIGNLKFKFQRKSPLPSLYTNPEELSRQQKSLKKSGGLNPARLILFAFIFLVGFLFLSDEGTKEAEKLKLKTQKEVEEELTALEKTYTEEKDSSKISKERKAAQIAFISGFRDYRKGYFQRALKTFRHCLTLDKNYVNCHRYIEKSKIQQEKLVQKKMLLGKRYQQNKQYHACKAIFKSVTIMVQDTTSLVYKEAMLNRKLCSSKTKNKL